MKVLLINGSPRKEGCTYTALKEIAVQLEKNGVDSEFFHLGNSSVAGCTACGGCSKGDPCVLNDDVYNRFIKAASSADGYIFGSPVYYANINASFGCLLDRAFYSNSKVFFYKPAAAVVSSRRGGSGSAFDRLNKYFTISNMLTVGSRYWNHVHGNTPEEVKQDLEGLQIMRTLADNMAWVLKMIDQTKETLPHPILDDKIRTNFIR